MSSAGLPTEPIGSIPRPPELAAARFIGPERLGTTDDCGFSPFSDDRATPRDVAFAKIAARVEGTAMASQILGAS